MSNIDLVFRDLAFERHLKRLAESKKKLAEKEAK